MALEMIVDHEKCTGCISCMLACSMSKERAYSIVLSRIRIERDEEHARFVPRVCVQCDERSCVSACSVNALSLSKLTGAIEIDRETCTGCRQCVDACPYGGVGFDEDRSVPLICDLCAGDPACVKACELPRAIRVGQRGG